MTDQSRVEAVRKALEDGFRNIPDQDTYTWQEMAELAIEANDAWLIYSSVIDRAIEEATKAVARRAGGREFGPLYEGYESSHRELAEWTAQCAISAYRAHIIRAEIAQSPEEPDQ